VERSTEAPAARAAVPGSALTIQQVRDSWPEILDTVQRAKRSAWAVVYTSYPLALKDDVLTLAFVSRSDVEGFKKPAQTGGGVSEVLRTAILDVLGLRVKFLPRVDGGAARAEPTPAAAPPVAEVPPDDPDDVPPPPDPAATAVIPVVPAPAVAAAPSVAAPPVVSEPLPPARWGSVAPEPDPDPEPDPAEPEPVGPPVATYPVPPIRPDEAQRYGEAVVREILGASFLEETVIQPSEVR
jgi:DNA polymerase-3 subunit gamma/tau